MKNLMNCKLIPSFIKIKIFYEGWEKIDYGFKNGILLLSKTDVMKNDSVDQQADILDTPEQKKFNDFSRQNKEKQKKYKHEFIYRDF